jgi:hypothetical protein
MQKPAKSVWRSFRFLKSGPVQTGRGPLGGGAGWQFEAHRGFNGTQFPGMGPVQQWGPAIDYSHLLGLVSRN